MPRKRKPTIDADVLAEPRPIRGLGHEGKIGERAREMAANLRGMFAESPLHCNIAGTLDELADAIDRLTARNTRLSTIIDRVEMGVDKDGHTAIVIRWHHDEDA